MRLSILTLLLLQVIFSFAQVNKQQISNALPQKLSHPYLFFSEKEKADILSLIETDEESKHIYENLLVNVNRMMYSPVEKFPLQYDHPRYYSDGKYDRQLGAYAGSAFKLAFMYQLTGDIQYAQKAYEFAEALTKLPSWIIKAHGFPIIYDRVWPWNEKLNDDNVVFSYDIRTAVIAFRISMVYDWCYDAFDKSQRDRIRNALYEKVILPVRNNYDYQWWATSYKCNWCGICFSGLGVASLVMLTEDESLTDVVAESYNRINKFLDHLGDDGAWQEGRGYWAYGMRESMFFMEALRKVSNGKYNLFNHKRIQAAPVDFALYGLTGNFGDGIGSPVGSTSMINKLIEQTSNGEGVWYRNHILKEEGVSVFDLIWPRPDVKEVAPQNPSKCFKSIDWAFMRTSFLDSNTVTVACKAGYNDDPHHGHLDIGQFIVSWQNKYFIRDLGNIAYDEQYFTNDRWNYPNASSKGHNLIFVNGELQKSAKYKDSAWEDAVGGKILDFRTSKERDYTLMDPTHAYPGKELKKWRRHIILEKPNVAIVLDEVSCLPGAEVEARFFPGVENVEYTDDYSLLSDDCDNTMAVFPVCTENVSIENSKLPFLPVKKDAMVQWLPFFSSKIEAKKETSYLATIIAPVKNKDEAEQIKNSIDISTKDSCSISFKYQGKIYTYNFQKTKEGLILDK